MDAPLIGQATQIDTGDTAWMLAATALVLMMTFALGLFYAGLVRAKNALNTFMMCVSAIAIAGIMWALIGYSLAFTIGAACCAGQVTVPAARSIRNWSLVKCPLGATAAWILTRGSMPAACRLASSGPLP